MSDDTRLDGRIFRKKPCQSNELVTMGDPVDASVDLAPLSNVGCFDLGGSCGWPVWCSRLPKFLENIRVLFSGKAHFCSEVFAGHWPKRGIFPSPRTRKAYARHILTLCSSGVLEGPAPCGRGITLARYFAVAKDVVDFKPTTARAIFDLTLLNNLSTDVAVFPLFSVSDLLFEVVSVASARGGRTFFVVADLKNFYYQLLLPDWCRPLFAIQMAEEDSIFLSRVLPMGWNRACRIAQSLTVAAIGARRQGEASLGMPQQLLEVDDPPGLFRLSFDVVPGMISHSLAERACGEPPSGTKLTIDVERKVLRRQTIDEPDSCGTPLARPHVGWRTNSSSNSEKGFCGVIYDTIFLCLSSRDLAEKWADRIRRNFREANLALKYLDVVEDATTFNGIDFANGRFGVQWRVAQRTFEVWKVISQQLLSTPRALFQGVGYIRRWAEVHLVQSRRFAKFTKVHAIFTSKHSREIMETNSPWWDRVDPALAATIQDLSQVIRDLENPWKTSWSVTAGCKRRRSSIAIIAVDATLKLISIVQLRLDGEIDSWPDARIAAPIVHGTVAENLHIDICEARAMEWGLSSVSSSDIVVLAGDNVAVGRSFWRGYSLADSIDGVIPQHRDGQTVIVVDIPSLCNIADVKTRPELRWSEREIDRRRKETFERCYAALQAWCDWPAMTYFERQHEIFSHLKVDSPVET